MKESNEKLQALAWIGSSFGTSYAAGQAGKNFVKDSWLSYLVSEKNVGVVSALTATAFTSLLAPRKDKAYVLIGGAASIALFIIGELLKNETPSPQTSLGLSPDGLTSGSVPSNSLSQLFSGIPSNSLPSNVNNVGPINNAENNLFATHDNIGNDKFTVYDVTFVDLTSDIEKYYLLVLIPKTSGAQEIRLNASTRIIFQQEIQRFLNETQGSVVFLNWKLGHFDNRNIVLDMGKLLEGAGVNLTMFESDGEMIDLSRVLTSEEISRAFPG